MEWHHSKQSLLGLVINTTGRLVVNHTYSYACGIIRIVTWSSIDSHISIVLVTCTICTVQSVATACSAVIGGTVAVVGMNVKPEGVRSLYLGCFVFQALLVFFF